MFIQLKKHTLIQLKYKMLKCSCNKIHRMAAKKSQKNLHNKKKSLNFAVLLAGKGA